MQSLTISTPRSGNLTVHLQGDIEQKSFCILTVHDLGCNHSMWKNFVECPSMSEIKKKALYIHVDVPGQEDNAEDLPQDNSFPSMQSLGDNLVCILDHLNIQRVIGLGEGAGADVLARFAMAKPDRCLGLCLIHCTDTTAHFMETVKHKLINWKFDLIGMNPTAEHYLVLHRFGLLNKAENKEQFNKVLASLQEFIQKNINLHNLNQFVYSFMKRADLTVKLNELKCPVLLVTDTNACFDEAVQCLAGHMIKMHNKTMVETVQVQGVENVLVEKPEKLAESFLYFCQGVGVRI